MFWQNTRGKRKMLVVVELTTEMAVNAAVTPLDVEEEIN